MWEILRAGMHVRGDWRLIYEQPFNCPSDLCKVPSTLTLALHDGQLDSDAQVRARADQLDFVDSSTVRLTFAEDRRHLVTHLPAGSYDVTVSEPCQQQLRQPLIVTEDQQPDNPYYVRFTCP